MFDFSRKKQSPFGTVAAEDDAGIEVLQMKAASRRGIWRESFRLLRDVFLLLAVVFLLVVFVAQPVVVDGNSMLPQLHDGERLLVNKLINYHIRNFSWGHIERGDVVVFWFPDNPDLSYVKRVIGLPGDIVEVRNGTVYVNDERMQENYIDDNLNKSKGNHRREEVKPHYYFVMGDNRDNSSDSRYWGLVPEKYIYGKVFFRYWVPSSIGVIPKGAFELNEKNSKDMRAEDKSKKTDE